MEFERTFDFRLVKSIITLPPIWKDIVDDFSPAPADYYPIESEGIWYILVRDAGEIIGLFVFEMRSHIVFEIHGLVLPGPWASGKATQAALGAIEWIWRHSSCRRIVAHVPVFAHRTRLRFPPKLGMTWFGTDAESFQRDGKLWDRACFGISKPKESLCTS